MPPSMADRDREREQGVRLQPAGRGSVNHRRNPAVRVGSWMLVVFGILCAVSFEGCQLLWGFLQIGKTDCGSNCTLKYQEEVASRAWISQVALSGLIAAGLGLMGLIGPRLIDFAVKPRPRPRQTKLPHASLRREDQ